VTNAKAQVKYAKDIALVSVYIVLHWWMSQPNGRPLRAVFSLEAACPYPPTLPPWKHATEGRGNRAVAAIILLPIRQVPCLNNQTIIVKPMEIPEAYFNLLADRRTTKQSLTPCRG
jgi:hypothetical protein